MHSISGVLNLPKTQPYSPSGTLNSHFSMETSMFLWYSFGVIQLVSNHFTSRIFQVVQGSLMSKKELHSLKVTIVHEPENRPVLNAPRRKQCCSYSSPIRIFSCRVQGGYLKSTRCNQCWWWLLWNFKFSSRIFRVAGGWFWKPWEGETYHNEWVESGPTAAYRYRVIYGYLWLPMITESYWQWRVIT